MELFSNEKLGSFSIQRYALQWRHNENRGVSNNWRLHCYFGEDQRKHQSSASLNCAKGKHRWPVLSPHQGPVTRKMFPFDDVIMSLLCLWIPMIKVQRSFFYVMAIPVPGKTVLMVNLGAGYSMPVCHCNRPVSQMRATLVACRERTSAGL